jgi:outer membrane lipoprotein-sorting protein
MCRKSLPLLMTLCWFCWPALGQVPTFDQLLTKHYEALGGLEVIKSVQSRRLTGRMTIGPGMEAPMTVQFKRPMKLRLDFTVQGMTGSQAFDGETAWMMMPFLGQTAPSKLPAGEAENLIRQAEFDGPLVDWKEKGHQVELIGEAQFEGKDTYKLKIVERNGTVVFHHLDRVSFLTVGQEGKVVTQGAEVDFKSIIRDYRRVGDMLLPHSFENRQAGVDQVQKITFDKIELNVDIADEVFMMPQ